MTNSDRVIRFEPLDGWRGVLALVVVFFHVPWMSPVRFPTGYLAVDVFFLLSGFVLTHAFDDKRRTGRVSPLGFFVARARRLLPLHLFVLSVVLLFALVTATVGITTKYYSANAEASGTLKSVLIIAWDALLLTQLPKPFAEVNGWGLNGTSWSISAELWVGPILLLVLGRRGLVPAAIAGVGGLLLYALVLIVRGDLHGTKEGLWLLNDGLLRGAGAFLLGYAAYKFFVAVRPVLETVRTEIYSLAEFALTMAVFALLMGPAHKATDAFIVPVGLGMLVVFGIGRGALSWLLRFQPFQFLGALSFHIYLWHQPLQRFFDVLKLPQWALLPAILLVSTGTWLLIDRMLAIAPRPKRADPAPVTM